MTVVACCLIILLFSVVVFALRSKTSGGCVPTSGLDVYELSARYRPMLRLLDGADFEFLSEAGDRRLSRKIRVQRRVIFRSYLRSLRRDHSMLCSEVRRAMVEADSDRRDLAASLVRMETAFTLLTSVIEFRLFLHALGFGSVTAAPLMKAFESVTEHAKLLSAPFAAVNA